MRHVDAREAISLLKSMTWVLCAVVSAGGVWGGAPGVGAVGWCRGGLRALPAPVTGSASAPGADAEAHRYGSAGCAVCQWCMKLVMERWGLGVRYVRTRA